jgi:hypothetical protein
MGQQQQQEQIVTAKASSALRRMILVLAVAAMMAAVMAAPALADGVHRADNTARGGCGPGTSCGGGFFQVDTFSNVENFHQHSGK